MYSYVVDHDHGENPNPFGEYCTLVHCKCKTHSTAKSNIVEMASVGDWIVGTGGKSEDSTGCNDCIIYIMQVTEKLLIDDYIKDQRFSGRWDAQRTNLYQTHALVSNRFCYFGKRFFNISELPLHCQDITKNNQGYRVNDIPENVVVDVVNYFEEQFGFKGKIGEPCSPTEKYNNQYANDELLSKNLTNKCVNVNKGCKS